MVKARPVSPTTSNDQVLESFEASPGLHALPVVEAGLPVGLINRHRFIYDYVRPYYRELYGKRPCTVFMDSKAIVVDKNLSVHEVSEVLLGADQRYLAEGFIVTDGGHYAGLGTGHDLMREITDMQIDAARYANPLTLLPGHIAQDSVSLMPVFFSTSSSDQSVRFSV